MATVTSQRGESAISAEALGLLDCFSCEFNELIYRLAEHVAYDRTGSVGSVEILPADINKAAEQFAEIMKKAEVPNDVKAEVDSMLDCLSTRLKKKTGR